MLEKPDVADDRIVDCMHAAYGIVADRVAFLPLGADVNAAVYRVEAGDGTPYFLKLRCGPFEATSATLPKWLSDQGIAQIIAPVAARDGTLWAELDAYKALLYPFVEGHDAYTVRLSDRHWRDFGAALRQIHTAHVPAALTAGIPRETFSPHWRECVVGFLDGSRRYVADDAIAGDVAALLQDKRQIIVDLLLRTAQLAEAVQTAWLEYVVCHSDVHAGNLHIARDGAIYIVDWDNPILAPKERDLMYVGAGLCGAGHTPQEEETLFYLGYGETEVNPAALAYYRYERIIQDIAAYCAQLLLTATGGEDRVQSLAYLASNFLPNGTIEIAYAAEKSRRG